MSTKQFLISGVYNVPSTSVANYNSLLGDGGATWVAVATEGGREGVISTPGKLSNFKAAVQIAPGGGKSWTFTVRKNNGDTALSVIIADANTISSLDTDEVEVAAGDKVCIQSVPSGTPAAAGTVYWTCQFTPDIDGETILLSIGTFFTADRYITLIGTKLPDPAEFEGQTLFPTDGTLKRFYVELVTAPGVGTSRTFLLRKNGVNTGMTVTIADGATTGNDTDPAHNIDIAAGDRVTIINTVTGSPASSGGKFGIVFLPDTPGEYIASATSDNYFHDTDTEYANLNCGDTTCWPTEVDTHQLAQETTAKAIYVNLAVAPGAGKGFTLTLRRNASVNTSLAVTLTGVTSGNHATDVAISMDDLLDTKIVPSGTPAVGSWQIAYLFYNAPLGWTGKISGVTNPAKVMGVAVANIARVKGVA